MAAFQWYIINLDEGTVEGTNNVEHLEEFLKDDSYLCLTGQHGIYYLGSRKENQVHELDRSDQDDPDEDG